jgi:hypothetical protein
MFVAPVLPSLAILNATWKVLGKLPVAWSSGSTDVTRPITWAARSTDITRPITWAARLANIPGTTWSTDVRLARATGVGSAGSANIGLSGTANIAGAIARLSGSPHAGSAAWLRGKCGCDIASAWTPTITESRAWPVLQEFRSSAAC